MRIDRLWRVPFRPFQSFRSHQYGFDELPEDFNQIRSRAPRSIQPAGRASPVEQLQLQGCLTDGGTPVTGNYDLQFALWDSASGGSQVGSTLIINSVAVSNGVLTATLTSRNSFLGASRFLRSAPEQLARIIHLADAAQRRYPRLMQCSGIASAPTQNATSARRQQCNTVGGIAANQYVQSNDSRLTDPDLDCWFLELHSNE
jgi:hypothetical protein